MQLETVINKTLRYLNNRLDALSMNVTSGGVDSMEKYKYMLGQAHAYQIVIQEISNLLEPKEQKNDIERSENVVDFERPES